MVLQLVMDLSNCALHTIFGIFGYLLWFAHMHLALGGVQLALLVLHWTERTERA